jgi:hypothetical protein
VRKLVSCFGLALGLFSSAMSQRKAPPPTTTVRARNISIANVTILSTQEQDQLAKEVLKDTDDEYFVNSWQQDFSERVAQIVGDAYKDRGYWKAEMAATVTAVNSDTPVHLVDVAVKIGKEGRQYRLSAI